MKNFFIDMLAFGALISSVLVITSKNPVIAVIFLISVFVNAAGYLICLGVGFLGLTYLIVYIGAISILFLFIVMLINVRISELQSNTSNSILLAILIIVSFNYSVFQLLPYSITIINNYYKFFYIYLIYS